MTRGKRKGIKYSGKNYPSRNGRRLDGMLAQFKPRWKDERHGTVLVLLAGRRMCITGQEETRQ